jgi:WD40 repeat protein/3',5'-cyclic AMP phosphodiesterase CpdA
MAEQIADAFVVRVVAGDGRTVGVGALVGAREILTCAHVVNVALGRDAREQEPPGGSLVSVEFPLLGGTEAGQPARLSARVERWLPPSRTGAAGDDIAGLLLVGADAPHGARPARVSVNIPPAGKRVRVFGYPGSPPRPNGAWVPTTIRGRVGGGRLQLDSGSDAALRVQPGFSGSPVFDDAAGLVVGLLASAPPARGGDRDSYAIDTARLRLAWPEAFERRSGPARMRTEIGNWRQGSTGLTVLHVSDTRFGAHHLSGSSGLTRADRDSDSLFAHLHDDLSRLADDRGLRPHLIVVTGDLAESGLRTEFQQAAEFLAELSEAVEVPRRHVAIVPGNHDVNQKAAEAYFAEQRSDERNPVPPYWPKWRQFAAAFADFYADVGGVTFTPDEPWTLFEMPDLAVVVGGLNSTMAESHRESDHYGYLGQSQLRWFAERLVPYRDQGWLRLAAVHHNVVHGAVLDAENLRDANDLDRLIGRPDLVNLLLHGHAHDGQMHRLGSGAVALSAGRAAVPESARPAETPSRYQLISISRDGFTRYARQYAPGERRWIGANGVASTGSDWRSYHPYRLDHVDATFPPGPMRDGRVAVPPGPRSGCIGRIAVPGHETAVRRPPERSRTSPYEDFLDRVAEATSVSFPGATITLRPESGYLRVSNPLPGGGAEQWPVGVADGEVTADVLTAFIEQVHARFASADPSVRSEFVSGGPLAPDHLIALARRSGVRLRSFVDYQGLVDLRPLADRQYERLARDTIYPARLYVSQRFRLIDSNPGNEVRTGLLDQITAWLSREDAQLVMVLGDFGRGKTSLLRQLARTLPGQVPRMLPVLVELRSLEKAPSLDELLAQHLVRQGVADINPAKLRYMIRSGRLALLFDGFDELELRVGYENAADYLHTLLESAAERAKIVLTSRTQHFQSNTQLQTALGERVAALPGSKVVVLEDFSEPQVREFLTNLYDGDSHRADARFELIAGIEDLLGLARNPRMLAFIAALDEDRLRAVQQQEGRISAAELYREIVDFWLVGEADRQRHRGGLSSLDEKERLEACTALALRLWMSTAPTIGLADLSAEVSATLTRLAERGYNAEQASQAIGSGSLLVRTDDGAFTFVHQSIMEWLVADAAARTLGDPSATQILTSRRMSRLMVDFLGDLAGHDAARRWAASVLADPGSSEVRKQNALAIQDRVHIAGEANSADRAPALQNLAGVDLRGQDLTGRDLRQADLRRADLRAMRLDGADFSGADLRDANFSGARLVGGSLRGAAVSGSRWHRAAVLGTEGVDELAESPELLAAAIASRDKAELSLLPNGRAGSVAVSPDGCLLAIGWATAAVLVDIAAWRPIRVLAGHSDELNSVAFSPEGSLLATASDDRTARIWDLTTGTTRTVLYGHGARVRAVAFSPDRSLLATASDDRSARIWDIATGTSRTTLNGHGAGLTAVAFAPDGSLLATASGDGTARIWDVAAGTTRATLKGHDAGVGAVAFSPDGSLLATASDDETARIWDVSTGITRTTLEGHSLGLTGLAFSPDGSLLATASDDETARIWDIATGITRTTLGSPLIGLNGVAFSPDGSLLATASDDETARIWDIATGTTRKFLEGHRERLWGVAFSPDGSLLATASQDGTARIWDVTTGATRTVLPGRGVGLTGVAFSPDGSLLATASDDETVQISDIATGFTRTSLEGHGLGSSGVTFSPDGSLLATTSGDGTARIWDAAGTTRATLKGHAQRLNGVAFSPDGSLLATTSDDRTARIWDVATGTTRTILNGHSQSQWAVAFSPDGRLLATTSGDRTARIWDVATGTTRATLKGHYAWVRGVAFCADGSLLATVSDDGSARIWDVASGIVKVTLLQLPNGGYGALAKNSYKFEGNPGNRFWWAIKLCRFAPGELDSYVPDIARIPIAAQLFPTCLPP